jgi:Short C-terminal domain
MPTNHALGVGSGSFIDHGNGVVDYRATGKVLPAFKVNVADITGFAVRKPTKQDKKNGAGRLQQVFVILGGGTELASVAVNYGTAEKLEAWCRSHPLFRGNVPQSSSVPLADTSANSTADELMKLAQLRDTGILSLAEFEQAKTKLLS